MIIMNLGPSDFAELANTIKAVRPREADILEDVEEIKACGANSAGGGGFRTGNTCARGGGGLTGSVAESVGKLNKAETQLLSRLDRVHSRIVGGMTWETARSLKDKGLATIVEHRAWLTKKGEKYKKEKGLY